MISSIFTQKKSNAKPLRKAMLWHTGGIASFMLVLLLLPSCANQDKMASLDIALTDGTHTGGLLLAVDDNWLVLDATGEGLPESPITLLDYGLIDTVTIVGQKYQGAGALLGGILGAVTGGFIGGGIDPANPNGQHTRTLLGVGAGLLTGAVAGFFIGDHYSDTDIVMPHPTDDDYVFLHQFAVYPDSLPNDLKFALDSVDAADSVNSLNNQ